MVIDWLGTHMRQRHISDDVFHDITNLPQFRSIFLCEVLLYIEVIFWN